MVRQSWQKNALTLSKKRKCRYFYDRQYIRDKLARSSNARKEQVTLHGVWSEQVLNIELDTHFCRHKRPKDP